MGEQQPGPSAWRAIISWVRRPGARFMWLAALGYVVLFGLVDAFLEAHAETTLQIFARLILVAVTIAGLALLVHVWLRSWSDQPRLQVAREEARLGGILFTVRELSRVDKRERVAPAVGLVKASRDHPVTLLTEREREVATLIAQGHTSREIADLLVITERTVDTHADRIRTKLGLHSRAAITAWVLSHGLVIIDRA